MNIMSYYTVKGGYISQNLHVISTTNRELNIYVCEYIYIYYPVGRVLTGENLNLIGLLSIS